MDVDYVDVEIIDKRGEKILRPYVANKYIKEFYGTKTNMTKELFDKNILSYNLISEKTGLTETVVRNIINGETKNVDTNTRRAIHIFFNRDFYPELGKYNSLCEKCRWRKCKQDYWVQYVACSKYKKSTRKRK